MESKLGFIHGMKSKQYKINRKMIVKIKRII